MSRARHRHDSPAPRRVFVRVVALVLCVPPSAFASAPSVRDLVTELKGISRNLNDARAYFDHQLERSGVTGPAGVEALSRAQMTFFEGDYTRAVVQLTSLIEDREFQSHAGYGEALSFLGESLWKLGLEASSEARFREALRQRGLPTAYRRTLSRYLRLVGTEPRVDELREYWRRYRAMRPTSTPSEEDQELQYLFGKALYHGGATEEADRFFAQVRPGDLWHVRALFLRAVIRLVGQRTNEATEWFEAARIEWSELSATPAPIPANVRDAPARERREVVIVPTSATAVLAQPPDPAAEERDRTLRRLGDQIHLALARLAAARDDELAAWQYYRAIPIGSPSFDVAINEASYVLFRREEYEWCARLVDTLTAEDLEDLDTAERSVWRAQLLALAADYQQARDEYEKVESVLTDRLARFDATPPPTGGPNAGHLFDPRTLAWSKPQIARHARAIEGTLLEQVGRLDELREALAGLESLLSAAGGLPASEYGRAIHRQLSRRTDQFYGRLNEAEEETRHGGPRGGAPGRLTGTAPRIEPGFAELRASADRLRARLSRFEATLRRFEHASRSRVRAIVAEEQAHAAALAADVDAQFVTAGQVARRLRSSARENIEQVAADARFGLVDLAFWRKDEITREIRSLMGGSDTAQRGLDASADEAKLGVPE